MRIYEKGDVLRMAEQGRVYTIGYTAFDQEQMIKTLKKYNIHCLIDVRTVPASARLPQYSRPVLEAVLKKAGIRYRHYPEFGARQEDSKWYNAEGYLDFERYMESEAFQSGIHKVQEGMRLGYRFTLMCAEKDPINCHRAIMVARGFSKAGNDVAHICVDSMGKDYLESQQELERRLMLKHGDNPDQMSLLETMDERIERAYRKQNEAIGYRMEDN